jgi:hypothetical protein
MFRIGNAPIANEGDGGAGSTNAGSIGVSKLPDKRRSAIPVSRLRPLALALSLALTCVALEAAADPNPPERPQTNDRVRESTASLRPDGSILWPVTNCDDAGAGSLRDVAASARHGDAIDLTSLACSTISLTSGAIRLRDVDLIGPGRNRLEIDGLGNHEQRVFDHASAGGTLSIEGLTVSGGKYTSNAGLGGGCLRSTGGSVDIRDSTFEACTVVAPVGSDSAARGGAIAVYGDIHLDGVTISGSLARTDHAFALGGGLYAQSGISMRRSTITGNSASASGTGAVVAGGGLFTPASAYILESTIDGNASDGEGGGGVLQRSGEIVRSTVSNNTSVGGASGIAISGIGAADSDVAKVYNSTFSGNRAQGSEHMRGGALYFNTHQSEIHNSTITNNTETNTADARHGAGVVFGPSAAVDKVISSIVSSNYLYDADTITFRPSDISGRSGAVISGNTSVVAWSDLELPDDTIAVSVLNLILPLRDNGGPTLTHMPSVGPDNLLINGGQWYQAGSVDQRGSPRIYGFQVDIGSVELNADDLIPETIFTNGFD